MDGAKESMKRKRERRKIARGEEREEKDSECVLILGENILKALENGNQFKVPLTQQAGRLKLGWG
eukprot:1085888-Amorphochlora_amoeboformis.AAC.1